MLEPWQEAQVARAIMFLPPATVNQRFTRWTKKAIAAFIHQRFGVSFSAWQVDCHLRRWGFESHKEARRAFMNKHASENVRHGSPQSQGEASPRL